MFKYINFKVFIIAFVIGILYNYISDDKKIIFMYPTPDNVNTLQYKDKSDNCFTYDLKEMSCPSDDNLIHNIKIQS
jgi:hypothetical protein